MESYASMRMRPVNHSSTRAAQRAVIHRVESEYERFDCISDMHQFGVKVSSNHTLVQSYCNSLYF